jgi:hypothetical protein
MSDLQAIADRVEIEALDHTPLAGSAPHAAWSAR